MPNKDKNYNATCAICGKPYHMCYSCKGKQNAMWKRHCDTAEHYKIYQLIHGYTTGLYTDAEAAAKLKNIDVSDVNELRPHIRDIIKKIQAYSKPKKTIKKPIDAVEIDAVERVAKEPAVEENTVAAKNTAVVESAVVAETE